MFDHPNFDNYSFEEIPLDRDIYLMDERWLAEYEQSMLRLFAGEPDDEPVGYISYAAAREVSALGVELSWYANVSDRFHEVRVVLPRGQFIACVGCWQCDEKPHIFVRSAWLERLHLRSYSVFAMVDAIGVKEALRADTVTREMLVGLRDRIDVIAERHLDISFISFADNVLLKSNWHVGKFDSEISYSYSPEIFIRLLQDIQSAYREIADWNVYAILTQGSNAYYDDPLLHISRAENHISLNSLGLPFAQLVSIDRSARKGAQHAELYMDESFFHSLCFSYEFDKSSCAKGTYINPLTGESSSYYLSDIGEVLTNLRRASKEI